MYVLLPQKKCFIFFAFIANSIPLDYVKKNVCSVIFSCFLLVRAGGPCFPLYRGICKFYASILDHRPILRCLILVRHQQQANLSLGNNYTPHVISYGCKNRGIIIRKAYFCINCKEFIKIFTENLKLCPLFRPRSVHFCQTF
jgi:hypothetical protein